LSEASIGEKQPIDYSLVGVNATLAVQKGLIVVQRPANLFSLFVLNVLDINALKMYVSNVALHLTGRLTPEELTELTLD
jgi:hypothetical protein